MQRFLQKPPGIVTGQPRMSVLVVYDQEHNGRLIPVNMDSRRWVPWVEWGMEIEKGLVKERDRCCRFSARDEQICRDAISLIDPLFRNFLARF